MQVVDKTKEDLANEVALLRQRVAELEKSEVVLKEEAILNTLVEHVIHEDREMKILWANKAACDSVGLSREEIIGKHCYEIWPKRSDPCPDCPVMKAMKTGQLQEVEKITPDGRSWFIRGYPLRDEKNNIVGGIEFTLEITERKQAEKELEESEVRFRALFEGAPDAIFLADPESGEILDANPTASHLLLRPHEEIVGLHQSQLHPPHMGKYVIDKFAEHLQQIRKKKQVRPIESAIIRSDGSEVPIEVLGQIVRIHGKEVIQGTFRDITERKKAEEALRESEERYRSLFENSQDAILLTAPDGSIFDVNPAACQMFGRTAVEITQIGSDGLVDATDPRLDAALKERTRRGKARAEITMIRADGSKFPVEITSTIFIDEQGQQRTSMIIRDISERKRAEEKLRESEERFRTICETAQDFIALKDRDCRFTYVNPAMERVFGIPASKLIGKTSEALFGKERSARIIEEDLRVLNGEIINEEHPSPVKGSSTIHNIIKVPIQNSAGEIIGLCNIGRDVTERKQTEKALKESEEKFRELAEQSPNMIFINAEGRVVYANKECEEMMGYTRQDFYDPNFEFFALIAPESKDVVKKMYDRHMKGEDVPPYEYTLITKKGERIEAIISPKMIQYGGESAILGIVTDITERKRMEEELRESEEKYRSLVESSEDSIYLVDNKCTYIFLNNRHLSRLGVQSSQVIGKEYSEFHSPEESKDFRQRVEKVLKTGQPLSYEYQSQRDNRYFIRTLSPVKSPDDSVINAITVISKDITERKQAEEALRESEEKYRTLFETAPHGIAVSSIDGRLLEFNPDFQKMVGYSGDELGQLDFMDLTPEKWHKAESEAINAIMDKGHGTFEKEYVRKDGTVFPVFLTGWIIRDEEGKPEKLGAYIEDITEHKQAEEKLREREAFNYALFQYNPVETIVVDREGRVTAFNLAKEKSRDRLPTIGDRMYKDYAGKHEIDMHAELIKCIRSGEIREFPERKYEDKYLSITISPFSQGAIIISEDITERKRAEELLQKERDTFYSILDRAPYGVMVVDAEGNHTFANSEFTNITGYTLGDIPTTQEWLHRAYPDQHYRNMVTETWEQNYTQNKVEETFRKQFGRVFSRAFNVKCKDGTAKEIEFRTASIGDEGTMFMLSDITERQRMHALLESAAVEWRTTFDAISDAVCLLDPQGKIIRCNNAMLKFVGKPFSNIINHHCWEVMHGVSKAPHSCPIVRVGKTHQRETEVMYKGARWINISVDPLLDEDGNYIGGVHIMSDITERMRIQNELQDSREQLRNLTVHLESVREQERTNIAREIHDELAQALTALRMDVSWLDRRLPADAQSLSEKTESMGNLIDSTIQTVKRISAELRPGVLDDLGLVAAIEWQAEEFQNRTGIRCRVTVDPDDIAVDQDLATAIFRIFQETLTNVARHARATRIAVNLKKRAEKLTLRVRDNGIGITEEQISSSQSFGLIGMQERVVPWDGKISFKGIPDKGTAVTVSVGLDQGKKNRDKN